MAATRVDAPHNYDRWPATVLPEEHELWTGADLWREIERRAGREEHGAVVAIDCYPGVDVPALAARAASELPGWEIVNVEDEAARPLRDIDAMLAPLLTEDRVFGVMSHLPLAAFYDQDRFQQVRDAAPQADRPTLLIGWGAADAVPESGVVVLADLARWEIQQRLRAGGSNWRAENGNEDILRKYKRGFFVEWRTADQHKVPLMERADLVLDTTAGIDDAKLITGDTFREGLAATVRGPFRVAPFFDPGVWGGQWMKDVCDLPPDQENYAWCFDCVPEENSLLLKVCGQLVEIPSIDLVLRHPRELLGALTFARFGAEFPIRFDFLDTMGGGNLSLQVHPLTEYIRSHFGMAYTQDESYYLLDAADDAVVYLGTRTGVEPARMLADLERAQDGDAPFPAEEYVNEFPARKHDHFLIPAGTVHCSGANSMVLEISATPFIFTFKMWDWGRLGLDGRPRPIHLEHARENIQWDRSTDWVRKNLVDRVEVVDQGEGWVAERTGLHELEFIETTRHWFTAPTPRDTGGTVHVINLVEGPEAVITSPEGAFEPFVVHYAETVIIPADVGPYTIAPSGQGQGQRLGTLTAEVRGTRSRS